ncbi:MAG: ATP-binding cassette domain-containing protein [Synergistaceae bacterium]|jgi:molybdate transport system ATP-binding protein|nr:ATP-binding cassette domain-containing protein [Synergistaceae bacterium]
MPLYVRARKNFGSFVLDVDFESPDGVMGLLGASGCGKSMTLKCIAGVVRPDEGLIISNGRVLFDSSRGINLPPRSRGVGLLFQNYALFPNMTVEGNIMTVLGRAARDAGDLYRSLISRFHLSGLEKRYPADLSGGQQQRTALARIMAAAPSLIMLDEPLSALDSYLRWQLEGELASILEEFGGVALYVSHNRDEVYRMCRGVCVMNSGRNEPVRTVQDLFDSPDTLASSLLTGCKNYSRIERVGPRKVRALDWNAELECGGTVADDAGFIGVRAHYVHPVSKPGDNVFSCRVERVTHDVFHTIVNLIPEGTSPEREYSRVRMEITREESSELRAGDIIEVGIKPRDVMPLKK